MANVLIIDVGTQSMRGIIFNSKGDTLAKCAIKYPPYVSPSHGYVEQDVEVYWQVLCEITQSLRNDYPELMDSVVAMSIETFRDSVVFLDKNLKPVRNAIIWSDQRISDIKPHKLPFKLRFCLKVVGMTRTIDAIRKKTRILWVKDNEPDNWAKTHKVVHVSAYLIYKLTGRLVDSYSASMGHLPFDSKNKRWFKKSDLLYPVFECDTSYMCDLVAPGDKIGEISQSVATQSAIKLGLPVYASGSDKGCETLGVGCFNSNVANVSFGTAASVQFSTKRYFEPEPMMPSYPAVLKDYYNPEVQIFRGYWMISWFRDNFAVHLVDEAKKEGLSLEEYLNREMLKVPAGSEGLVLQPFWQAGLTNPEARGAIVGFSDYHNHAHIYRAIIEGIDFALREGLERMERRGKQKIDYISVSGGGSQSDIICQVAADVFNKPVRRVQTYETSALGAAIVTLCACGEFENTQQAVDSMVHYQSKVFTPNKENAKVYDDIYNNVYLKLYSRLQQFYLHLQ